MICVVGRLEVVGSSDAQVNSEWYSKRKRIQRLILEKWLASSEASEANKQSPMYAAQGGRTLMLTNQPLTCLIGAHHNGYCEEAIVSTHEYTMSIVNLCSCTLEHP